jgi:hypothetical protein
MLNLKCSCIWAITVPTVDIWTRFTLQGIFIPCVIQSFLSLPMLLYLLGKLASKVFRKVKKISSTYCWYHCLYKSFQCFIL